jgi:magnesium transporter
VNEVKLLGELYFSKLLNKPIYDGDQQKVGRVIDMAVRWTDAYPQVIGIRYASKIHKLIPINQVATLDERSIHLNEAFAVEKTIPLPDKAIYISKWLLDKQIIDLKGSRMVRVNDISLSFISQKNLHSLILVAVDIGLRGLLRRLGCEFLVKNCKHNLLGMQYIKPLENWNSDLQISREKQQLSELHPADIADLLEEMGHKYRIDFIQNLDAKLAVDTLSEVDLDTQVDIIEQMDQDKASDILEEMPLDEVADILGELSHEKSEELLKMMETDDAEDVRELMQYDEGNAGALMTTEFIAFSPLLTAEQAIVQLRQQAAEAETIYYLYVIDEQEHLLGVFSLRELIIAAPEDLVQNIMHRKVASVDEFDDYRRVADVINKYGLLAVPVVDEQQVLLGIVTVDDILDVLMPERTITDTYSMFMLSDKAGRRR